MITWTTYLLSWQRLSFWSSLSTIRKNFVQIFRISSSSQIIVCTVPTLTSNCTHCLCRLTTVLIYEILYLANHLWCSDSLTPPTPPITYSLPSLNLLCHSKTHARFMQDAPKAVWSIPYVYVAFFPSLKPNFYAYRSSKVSTRPDCIFEIHHLWQSGFSRVYFNSCCCCWFEAEIIKIGQSSNKMYSNKIVNSQF